MSVWPHGGTTSYSSWPLAGLPAHAQLSSRSWFRMAWLATAGTAGFLWWGWDGDGTARAFDSSLRSIGPFGLRIHLVSELSPVMRPCDVMACRVPECCVLYIPQVEAMLPERGVRRSHRTPPRNWIGPCHTNNDGKRE